MKKKYRLLKNQDFKKVLDYRKLVSRENFKIYHKTNDLNHFRVGISVSSKIGNSVVRHKIKRQVVSMLDQILDLSLSYDIIVIVRSKYLDNSYLDNYKGLEKIIRNINKGEVNND
jgi:ribonuclease P protein component